MSKTTSGKPLSKAKSESKPETIAQRALARHRARFPKGGFSGREVVERIAALQAVKLERQFEKIFGAGAHVWSTDEEFHRAVQEIYDRRRAAESHRENPNPDRP